MNSLNESPSEKEGKYAVLQRVRVNSAVPSMKVPPKRKGNADNLHKTHSQIAALNESPSEKEGKFSRRSPGLS